MPLTAMERKARLEHGAQRRIALKARVTEGYVSRVVAGTLFPSTAKGRAALRRLQSLVARELRLPRAAAFADMAPPQEVGAPTRDVAA